MFYNHWHSLFIGLSRLSLYTLESNPEILLIITEVSLHIQSSPAIAGRASLSEMGSEGLSFKSLGSWSPTGLLHAHFQMSCPGLTPKQSNGRRLIFLGTHRLKVLKFAASILLKRVWDSGMFSSSPTWGLSPTFSFLLWLLSFPKRCLCFGVHLIIWLYSAPCIYRITTFSKKNFTRIVWHCCLEHGLTFVLSIQLKWSKSHSELGVTIAASQGLPTNGMKRPLLKWATDP